jgi:hypothetical protein
MINFLPVILPFMTCLENTAPGIKKRSHERRNDFAYPAKDETLLIKCILVLDGAP